MTIKIIVPGPFGRPVHTVVKDRRELVAWIMGEPHLRSLLDMDQEWVLTLQPLAADDHYDAILPDLDPQSPIRKLT